MNQPLPTQTAASSRSGCGCWRGCLVAIVVVLVLLVGGAAAGYAFGRPYIARQLPEWEARQPLLGIALDLLGLRAHLVDAGAFTRMQRERLPGENARDRLPADLAIYPDAVAETYNVNATQVTAFQRVRSPLEPVREHLLRGMAKNGWKLKVERAAEAGLQLGWVKDERNCQVDLVERASHTEVWLRSNGASQ